MTFQRFNRLYKKGEPGILLLVSPFLILIALLLNAPFLFAGEEGPFQGSFTPAEITAKVGDEVTAVLEFQTTLAFAEVEVNVKVPAGVTITSGAAQEKITDFKVGEKKKYEYKFKINEKGEKQIFTSIKTIGLASSAYGETFIITINKEEKKDPSTIKTDKEGNQYIIRKIPVKK